MIQRLLAIAFLGVGVSYFVQGQIALSAIWVNLAALMLNIVNFRDDLTERSDRLAKRMALIEEENGLCK